MTTIKIPTAEELRTRLNGIDRLLTATKWERAAIVFAYTEPGEVGRGRFYKPTPPKLNIRNFAGQGYIGLSTPKAVARYREAWTTAINNGWAVPVEPGQTVELPDQPFPAWPYGEGTTYEDHAADELRPTRGPNRPLVERVYGSLDRAASAIRQLAEQAAETPLSEAERTQVAERLRTLRNEAESALRALEPVPA